MGVKWNYFGIYSWISPKLERVEINLLSSGHYPSFERIFVRFFTTERLIKKSYFDNLTSAFEWNEHAVEVHAVISIAICIPVVHG